MADADPSCQLSLQPAVKPATGSVAVSTVARRPSTEWPIQFGAVMADAYPDCQLSNADQQSSQQRENRRCKYCALNLIPETAVRALRRCQEIRPAAATPRTSDRTQLQAHGMSTVTVSQTRKTSEYELHFYVAFLRKQSLRGCKAYRDLEHLEAVQDIIFEVCASETDMTSNDPTNGCITDSIRPTKPADINVLESDVHLANAETCFPVQLPMRRYPLDAPAELLLGQEALSTDRYPVTEQQPDLDIAALVSISDQTETAAEAWRVSPAGVPKPLHRYAGLSDDLFWQAVMIDQACRCPRDKSCLQRTICFADQSTPPSSPRYPQSPGDDDRETFDANSGLGRQAKVPNPLNVGGSAYDTCDGCDSGFDLRPPQCLHEVVSPPSANEESPDRLRRRRRHLHADSCWVR